MTAGLATEDELKAIDKDVRKEVETAIQAATSDPVLPPEALYCDIFSNTEAQLVRGATVDDSLTQPFLTSADLLKSIGRQPKA